MNPQRLVAAVAALAVGFGVTLLGVSIDDSADDAVASVESEEVAAAEATDDDGGEEEGAVDEPAEQEEEAAEEPEPAEVDEPVDVEDQAETDSSPQSQDAPANPAESAPATTVVMEVEDAGDVDPFDDPRVGLECVDVVSLPTNRGFVDFVFVSFRTEFVIELLDEEGRVIVELPEDFDVEIVPREVLFEDGLPVEFGSFCTGEPFDEGPIDDGPFGEAVGPCEGIDLYLGAVDIFEASAPRYGDALSVDEATDLDAYRFLVAAAAERAASGSFAEFFDAATATITGFRDECPFDVELFTDFDLIIEFFIDDDFDAAEYEELLCNLGQLSADSRLIDFLDGQAQAFDTISCEYAEEA